MLGQIVQRILRMHGSGNPQTIFVDIKVTVVVVRSFAICKTSPNKDKCSTYVIDEECKVFACHERRKIIERVRAKQFLDNRLSECCIFRAIHNRRCADMMQDHLAFCPEGGSRIFCNPVNHNRVSIAERGIKIAQISFQNCLIWNGIKALSRSHLSNCDQADRLRVEFAADNGLQVHHDRGCGYRGINPLMGSRSMCPFTCDAEGKQIRASHTSTRSAGDFTDRDIRPDMDAKAVVYSIENARLLNILICPAMFFARFEKQFDRSADLFTQIAEDMCGTEQRGHMSIMPACMHNTVDFGFVRTIFI